MPRFARNDSGVEKGRAMTREVCAAVKSIDKAGPAFVYRGGTKRVMTDATGSGLALSQGEEDLVSHEDKHSKDDSNAGKSKFGIEVIRYNC